MTRPLTISIILLCTVQTVLGQITNYNYWEKLPKPSGWVNDFDDVFTKEQELILDSLIDDYEKNTKTEISVVTIPTSATMKDLFDKLTLYMARKWAIGKRELNNGILIGISPGYHLIRIQNSRGIEKLITNDQTKEIIDQVFIPYFKTGDFFTGTFQGIQEMKQVMNSSLKSDTTNLYSISVYQYIERLKINNHDSIPFNILTICSKTPENWVTAYDIDSLMTYISSTEPAKCIIYSTSSRIPVGESSTIGGHVMYIIEAYMDSTMYPGNLPGCAMTEKKRIKRITKRWLKRK